ncbi:1948_t:CDS:10 [Ambispora leptoticha]|uniref:Protein PNS1 n=1 Tax=Ambispora leptoticha TaxID=144679 RepID=A0A9N9F8Y6_9GLOM|nr:1948_t:CDS:10 [Ambispora leptoticha]
MSTTDHQQQQKYTHPSYPNYGIFSSQPPPSYTGTEEYSHGFSQPQTPIMPMPMPQIFSAHTPPSPPSTNTVDDSKYFPRPKYQDLWAAILFLLHFAAYIVISIIALANFGKLQRSPDKNPAQKATLNWSIIWLLLFNAGVGFFFSLTYLSMAEKFPRQFITATFIISIGFYWAITIYFFVAEYLGPAILFLFFSGFYTFLYLAWRPLIPLSAALLETVVSITKRYKATILVAFGGLLLQFLYQAWWIFTITAAYQYWYPPACSKNPQSTQCDKKKINSIAVFLIFSFYWTSQVIQVLVHVTLSGVFAAYYFLEGTPQGMPRSPTLESLKRATTTSFGSVCLGSLIVALLQTIRALLRAAAQESDNPFGQFCALCAECIVAYIDALLQFFNFYAYTQVAIYGKSYVHAAKDTWTLIKERGVELIANDILVGNVLVMGSILIGMITALLGYLFTIVFQPDFNHGGTFTPLIVFLAFIMGFQMMNVLSSVIHSGVATTFVALAEDPAALYRTKPALFEMIRQAYPNIALWEHLR